jgi:hypothetical protein
MLTRNHRAATLLHATVLCAIFCGAQALKAQTPTPTSAGPTVAGGGYVLGEITAIDAAGKRLTIKTEAGGTVSAVIYDRTEYARIPPGATNLKNKQVITLGDVNVGDRAMAWGRVSEDGKTVQTRQLVVLSKADLARKREHEREEWDRRGVVGLISAINPATKEVTLMARTPEGPRPMVVAAGAPNVRFRRYAPDSVKFDDARPSSFEELKVGDVMRALGEKSADGARLTPEEVVSGSFRMVGGSVTEVDAGAGEVKIKDARTGQPLTVRIAGDSMLRRLPPEVVATLAQRKDQQEIFQRLPAISIADLKPGDAILVSSTTGADPSRVTAIILAAGVEALLKGAPPQPGRGPQSPALSIPGLDVVGLGLP